jgi:ribosomal protein S12 methylthiotransferase
MPINSYCKNIPLHTYYEIKNITKDKVNIITLGCSKNLVDSEVLSGQLKANEIDVVHENSKLDHNIVVVNTCGFIDKAKEESINTILDQVRIKKERQA